ncbi:MAG: 30S ribosomal protein S1, partial [Candidatus Binatia bacterium]
TQGRWAESGFHQPESRVIPSGPLDRSLAPHEVERRWEHLEELFNEGTVLCLPVSSYNKGGLLIDWEGMQGFIPVSQLLEAPIQAGDCARMDFLASHVGTQLKVKVIELERAHTRIIFSQRAARWGECCPDTLLATLRPGDVCDGDVSNLCDFGVFVDLGGIDGLIHVSELSWRRVNHPRDVLQVGQRIKIYVIDVDPKRRRVALSLKRLQPNPWATVAEHYRAGMVVEAFVTNVVEFGAFARLEDGVEGLIHVSELTGDDATSISPPQTVREGERVRVRILSVDPENQRMGLSLRGLDGDDNSGAGREEPRSRLEEMYQDGAQSLP